MREFGVGIVGFGWIGGVHSLAHRVLPALYSPLPATTRLVGVCTRTEESGDAAISKFGFEFATTDLDLLLAHPDIDLVHVCSPNDKHHAHVRAALLAGKHVYCDKPLAVNVEQAVDLVHLAESSGTVAQITFNYRFVPAVLRARELVKSGFLGDLYTFRAAYLHSGYTDPARPYSWRTDFSRSGGGAVMDLGAHAFDLTRFLTGPGSTVGRAGEAEAVSAELQTIIRARPDGDGKPKTVDVDDMAWSRLRLEGGAVGTVEAARLATGVQDELRIELHGSRGALKFNLMDPNWLDAYSATLPEAALGGDRGFTRIECATRYPKPYAFGGLKSSVGWMSFHFQSLFDFVNNAARVEDGLPVSPESPSFADGLAVQRTVAAVQLSARSNGVWTPVASHNG